MTKQKPPDTQTVTAKISVNAAVLVAAVSLLGTLLSSYFATGAQSQVILHRLDRLEAKVEQHNNFSERVFAIEAKIKSIEKDIGFYLRGR